MCDADYGLLIMLKTPPSALENIEQITRQIQNKHLVVFLDYDGTIVPIVDRPAHAVLSIRMRETLRSLAKKYTVVIVSGRDLADVHTLVMLENIFYAGNHGFDIAGPAERNIRLSLGTDFSSELDDMEQSLREHLKNINGIFVERKKYSIAIHYRLVAQNYIKTIKSIVDKIMAHHPRLRKTFGKKILELQPDIDWNKGKAVCWLLKSIEINRNNILPLYIGDDTGDESAFHELKDYGVGIRVGEYDHTEAQFRLKNTAEVKQFLEALIREEKS